MSKVALLTIWHCNNYGAELQTYATVRAIQELGHNVKVINFRLSDNHSVTLKTRVIRLIQRLTPTGISFRRFWSKYIPVTKRYLTLKKLCDNPPMADIYIVGSDQTWNPYITEEKALSYFLNFGPDSVLRVSYASSIGESSWNHPDLINPIKEALSRFSAISCREKQGVRIIQETFDISAKRVLDPTLLHLDYAELIGNVIPNNSVVYYALNENSEFENFAKNIAQNLGLGFINTNKKYYAMRKIVLKRPSVQQWLNNIAGASLVLTHSFHGLAFSIIYKRNFVIIQSGIGNHRSSRITDLLSDLGLLDRYFTSYDDAMQSQVWKQPINWGSVYEKLERLRIESRSYLASALR